MQITRTNHKHKHVGFMVNCLCSALVVPHIDTAYFIHYFFRNNNNYKYNEPGFYEKDF
tara:strand:- start:1124 stop:1297 length:174 start_codon:yes stop_codon:yes gene_type:complete